MKNKSFCAVPFVSMMVNTDSTIRYCCMVKGSANKLKKSDDKFYTVKDNFINDAWNSEDMRQIRLSMIAGERIKGCSTCYLQEESGRTSNRQHSIDEWSWCLGGSDQLQKKVQQAIDNDGKLLDDIVYLDLRLGNLCNLKCRMCNPWNSSQIYHEHVEIEKTDSEYVNVWNKNFGKFPVNVMDYQQWFDHHILWDQINSLIPTLKKVYMTGGEPTLIKNNFKFMQNCLDQQRDDITLFFNTNCTNVNKTFINLIKQFKNVSINASVDGVGIVNDYIRAPSAWSEISKNVEKLAELKNVTLGITPTIQIYNIFDIVNILKWVSMLNKKYDREIFIDFLINVHPPHLNINILSDDIKLQALKDIEQYIEKSSDNLPILTRNSLSGIIGLLKQKRSDNWHEEISKFKTFTQSLDDYRKQNIKDLDSRLMEIYNDA